MARRTRARIVVVGDRADQVAAWPPARPGACARRPRPAPPGPCAARCGRQSPRVGAAPGGRARLAPGQRVEGESPRQVDQAPGGHAAGAKHGAVGVRRADDAVGLARTPTGPAWSIHAGRSGPPAVHLADDARPLPCRRARRRRPARWARPAWAWTTGGAAGVEQAGQARRAGPESRRGRDGSCRAGRDARRRGGGAAIGRPVTQAARAPVVTSTTGPAPPLLLAQARDDAAGAAPQERRDVEDGRTHRATARL